MRPHSAQESARVLPRKWMEEEWGIGSVGIPGSRRRQGRLHKIRPGSAPSTRPRAPAVRENTHVYHTYTGRRVPAGKPQLPLRRRTYGRAEGGGLAELKDEWGRGGQSFARKGLRPQLEAPRPPKAPTRSHWPTRSVEASVLRYIGLVRREKVGWWLFFFFLAVSRGRLDGGLRNVATMAWPEHGFIESGDVVVTVEHCHECHGHRMTTRHDPEVYLRHANAVKELLIESLRRAPIRLAVVLKRADLQSEPAVGGGGVKLPRRVGAFEVQVAARHPREAKPVQAQVVHSKLASGRWPRLGDDRVPNRVKTVLSSWGFKTDVEAAGGGGKNGAGGSSRRGDAARKAKVGAPGRRRQPLIQMEWEFDNRESSAFAALSPPSYERKAARSPEVDEIRFPALDASRLALDSARRRGSDDAVDNSRVTVVDAARNPVVATARDPVVDVARDTVVDNACDAAADAARDAAVEITRGPVVDNARGPTEDIARGITVMNSRGAAANDARRGGGGAEGSRPKNSAASVAEYVGVPPTAPETSAARGGGAATATAAATALGRGGGAMFGLQWTKTATKRKHRAPRSSRGHAEGVEATPSPVDRALPPYSRTTSGNQSYEDDFEATENEFHPTNASHSSAVAGEDEDATEATTTVQEGKEVMQKTTAAGDKDRMGAKTEVQADTAGGYGPPPNDPQESPLPPSAASERRQMLVAAEFPSSLASEKGQSPAEAPSQLSRVSGKDQRLISPGDDVGAPPAAIPPSSASANGSKRQAEASILRSLVSEKGPRPASSEDDDAGALSTKGAVAAATKPCVAYCIDGDTGHAKDAPSSGARMPERRQRPDSPGGNTGASTTEQYVVAAAEQAPAVYDENVHSRSVRQMLEVRPKETGTTLLNNGTPKALGVHPTAADMVLHDDEPNVFGVRSKATGATLNDSKQKLASGDSLGGVRGASSEWAQSAGFDSLVGDGSRTYAGEASEPRDSSQPPPADEVDDNDIAGEASCDSRGGENDGAVGASEARDDASPPPLADEDIGAAFFSEVRSGSGDDSYGRQYNGAVGESKTRDIAPLSTANVNANDTANGSSGDSHGGGYDGAVEASKTQNRSPPPPEADDEHGRKYDGAVGASEPRGSSPAQPPPDDDIGAADEISDGSGDGGSAHGRGARVASDSVREEKSFGDGDEYGSDFASQDGSSIEQTPSVQEESLEATVEQPAVPPPGEVVERDAEEQEVPEGEEGEPSEEEEEYGDDFDDEDGSFERDD
eukprot:jgi/Undpi1/8421/HiC_scaffold_25.g10889.m1